MMHGGEKMEDIMNMLGMFWPFLVLIAVFYFFMYRPQKKLQLERGRFLLSLRKGDRVVTSGGVHGVIKLLRDKYVELEIAPKVVIKVEKAAIHHGDVKLVDEKIAKEEAAKAKHQENMETQVTEEVIEVNDPKEAGTEVIEEVIEVDENGKPIKEDKK